MHQRHQAYALYYRNVYILVFRVFVFLCTAMHVKSLAFCVWEWRRYTNTLLPASHTSQPVQINGVGDVPLHPNVRIFAEGPVARARHVTQDPIVTEWGGAAVFLQRRNVDIAVFRIVPGERRPYKHRNWFEQDRNHAAVGGKPGNCPPFEILKNAFSCQVQHQVTIILNHFALPQKISAGCSPDIVYVERSSKFYFSVRTMKTQLNWP